MDPPRCGERVLSSGGPPRARATPARCGVPRLARAGGHPMPPVRRPSSRSRTNRAARLADHVHVGAREAGSPAPGPPGGAARGHRERGERARPHPPPGAARGLPTRSGALVPLAARGGAPQGAPGTGDPASHAPTPRGVAARALDLLAEGFLGVEALALAGLRRRLAAHRLDDVEEVPRVLHRGGRLALAEVDVLDVHVITGADLLGPL